MAVHGGSGISHGVIEQTARWRCRKPLPGTGAPARPRNLGRAAVGQEALGAGRAARAMRDGQDREALPDAGGGALAESGQHVKLPLHKYVTDDGRAARHGARGREAVTHHLPRLQGLGGFQPAGSGTQDRPHPSDPRAPRASGLSDRRRRQYGDFALNRAAGRNTGLKRMFLHAASSASCTRSARAHADRGAAAADCRFLTAESLEDAECPSTLTCWFSTGTAP